MTAKSIDGLTRRPRQTVGEIKAAKTSKSNIRTRKPITKPATPAQPANPENDEAIRDFLSSVQDSNPTDLIGLPPEKEEPVLSNRERKKAAKRAKKAAETKAKSQKKPHKVRKIILRVLGILLLLILALVAWVYIQGNDFISRVTGGGDLLGMLFSDPDTPLETDPSSGRTNVLIFGTEGYSMDDTQYAGGQLTDSMMVASLNQETGDIKTVSLPRDLKTKTCNGTSKLNEIYQCTYSKNKGTTESRQEYETKASQDLAAEAEKILGLKIQYFVHVNWQALVQIVDSIGGIDIVFTYGDQKWDGPEVAIETTSKKGLADYNRYCKCYIINYRNGEVVHLNGDSALAVARARNEAGGWGAGGGNFSREIFQQKIIQATLAKAKDTNFATDFISVLSIKDAVGDNLRMNFKDKELKTLFKLATTVDIGSMQTISLLDNDEGEKLLTTGMLNSSNQSCDGGAGCYSYVFPKAGAGQYTQIHKYIARKFSSNPTVSENAEITVMNATSVAGLAASEGKKLENKGLNIISTTNAPEDLKSSTGITIYQLNKSLANTAKTLSEFYHVEITTTIPDSLTNNKSDFVIIIGNGYAAQ